MSTDQSTAITLRSTTRGEVTGVASSNGSVHAWLGIPYAKPPTGDRRWRAPEPIDTPWSDVKPATAYGAIACQQKPVWRNNQFAAGHFLGSEYVGSEDCLYLNIWAPPFQPNAIPTGDQRLPVMVWIHGGGDIWGSGELPSGRLAMEQNVILVSFNYRLGAFGWLSHATLREQAESEEEASGNFGTLDMIEALRWVKSNISSFGGDPNCVTIFGISAGAWNVLSLLTSPLARGLFHRAIVQGGWPKHATRAHAENFHDDAQPGHPQSSNELLVQLLMDGDPALDRDAAKGKLAQLPGRDIRSLLYSQSYESLERAYLRIEQRCKDDYFPNEPLWDTKLGRHIPESSHSVPKLFGDGVVIDERPLHQCIAAGAHNAVPVLLGTNRDEATFLLLLDPDFVEEIDGRRRIRDPKRYRLSNEYLSKLWKASGADEIANNLVEHQGEAVFVYRFDWDDIPSVNGEDLKALHGAAHGIEGHFMFGADVLSIGNQPRPPGSDALCDAVMAYWASFARTGNPNSGNEARLPTWQPWSGADSGQDSVMMLDSEDDQGIAMASYTCTRETVLQEIERDARCQDARIRHQLMGDLLHYGHTYITYQQLVGRFPVELNGG
ncbi:carboxylesterase family protein [Porticoccaceae bacterium]|nr:carboxylesterase family protein [Porticoccaceae bacterium]